jgi:hypothetical protein
MLNNVLPFTKLVANLRTENVPLLFAAYVDYKPPIPNCFYGLNTDFDVGRVDALFQLKFDLFRCDGFLLWFQCYPIPFVIILAFNYFREKFPSSSPRWHYLPHSGAL